MEKLESSSDHKRSERRLPPPPKIAPWLVYPHASAGKLQTFCNIFEDNDQDTKKSFKKFIPELSKKLFWQKNSHQGWLISFSYGLQDPNSGRFFLWNPVSLETILLPRVPDGCRVLDCVLSSPPQLRISSDNLDHDSDSMVYILYYVGVGRYDLIYCHPGEKEWRKHEFVVTEYRSPYRMLCLEGKLYVMCLNCAFLEITIRYGSAEEELSVSDYVETDESTSTAEWVGGRLENHCQKYWIESFGEIFRIYKYAIGRGIYQDYVTQIFIRRLDFNSMAWKEVKSLDDHVFFLGNNTQLSCLASDLGLSKGYVYFNQDKEMSLYKYDIEDDSVLLSFPCPDLPAPWYMPEWLMISATSRLHETRKTTNHMSPKDKTIDRDDKKLEDTEEARPWSLLNDAHIVWLISNYLHTLDYIHLRGVSKNIRTILNLKRASPTRALQATDLSPWLVFPKYDQAVHNFVNPMHDNENYLMYIPDLLKGSRIRFSKGGWLLLSKGKTLFFYNPFTRSTVKLPDLPDSYNHYNFTGNSFSSLPTSSDCVVFAIGKESSGDDEVDILYIKRGDECWTHNVFGNIYLTPRRENVDFETSFNNPVFYLGAFYCLDRNGTLGVFKLEPDVSWEIISNVARPNCDFIYRSFLVECDGKLMAVLLGHFGKWVRILRLTEMAWVEVKRLGRHMLCISNTSCISAVAPTSRMENKIYFSRLHNEGVLYYSLDTCKYHSFGSKHSAKDFF